MNTDTEDLASLADELVTQLGERLLQRATERVWGMSGVERLQLCNSSVIYKYAYPPFDHEDRVLAHVSRHGLAVPQLLASIHRNTTLGMLLQDLGEPTRSPSLSEAARAAVAVHTTPAPEGLPVLDGAALAALPDNALEHLNVLRGQGRWPGSAGIADGLRRLTAAARRRSHDVQLPPFGLVHSEFHESSVHIGAGGQMRVLDMARAFVGPGLLDLASWQGTTTEPDPRSLRELLHAYVAAGGPDAVLADRSGLSPERWALGWHHVWVVTWYLEQAYRWDPQPDFDEHDQAVVGRHVAEARACLEV